MIYSSSILKGIKLQMEKLKKYMPYIIILFVTIVICAPIFTMNLYKNNEAVIHMTRVLAIDEVVKDGVFPPIINHRFMNGTGYALNLFYGPITTYIPMILLNIFGTAGMAIKIFTLLTVFISAIMMYRFVYTVTKKRKIAVISAIIYISMPYKLSNIYSRNAVGEYTAFVFIPIVFEALYNLVNGNQNKKWLLSIGIIGLVLSHTITTVYTAIFSIIYLLLNIKKLKNLSIWINMISNVIVSLLVCSFYVVPLLEHTLATDYAIYGKQEMGTTCESVSYTTLGFKDLLKSEMSGDEIRFSVGIVVCVLSVLTIFCIRVLDKNIKKTYIDFIILSVFSILMVTKIFPWKSMPEVLGVIQFAWRGMGFFAFFISLICGINAVVFAEKILIKEMLKNAFIFAVICSVAIFTFLGVFRDWRFDDILAEKQQDSELMSTQKVYVFRINREYLPMKAIKNLEYINQKQDAPYVISGSANIIYTKKDKLNYNATFENVQTKSAVELPYLYYLGYTVEARYDDIVTEVDIKESPDGCLMVELPEAENLEITLKYEGTVLEKVGYIISILGIILLGVWIKFYDKIEGDR